jgi:hypothetical protein
VTAQSGSSVAVGDRLLVWPGARIADLEPRRAQALSGPVPFGGTTCVRVRYLSGRRVGGTDYIALTHVEADQNARSEGAP